ncbi:MAG: AIR carboxylase family protein, partial [Lachnospiraceae bacterium]|nr:AIR carboxylase family protein [Lachnospiraceae bacterium]
HLPGMCAAIFPMPVIGVPLSGSVLDGEDALYSILQMPPGIPVATVAINGGANAGLLAARILSVSDSNILKALKDYKASLKDQVVAKNNKLKEVGRKEYTK